MFVAIARIPDRPEAIQEAARIAGLAPADASRLLAGTLPRVLVRNTGEAGTITKALETAGFVALSGDPAEIPSEKDRVVTRRIAWIPGGLAVTDAQGRRHECPGQAIALIQRGLRSVETSELVRTTERRLDVGRALISGGLVLTRKVEKTRLETETSKEAFLLIQRTDDPKEIILHERRLDYAGLGEQLRPSTFANLMAVLQRLRDLAPEAPFDDRVSRPGFVSTLPLMAVDPVDLALHLVRMARSRGEL